MLLCYYSNEGAHVSGVTVMANAVERSNQLAATTFWASRRRFLGWIGAGLAALAIPRPLWAVTDPKATYSETIAVLSVLYRAEVGSHLRYKAYETQAMKDGHVNIAHLFAATADSESVHATRFREILSKLGVQVETPEQLATQLQITSGTTKDNLKYATDVELSEIDVRYPEYLARIQPEKHKNALKYIEYSWKAEQQHRELIKDIQSGTGIFFGMLAEKFRSTKVRYFVCQNCGSTLTVMPTEKCPVCGFLIKWYKEIMPPQPEG